MWSHIGGEVGGLAPLLNGLTSAVVLKVEESTGLSLPPPTIPVHNWDSNTQPSGYKSDSLITTASITIAKGNFVSEFQSFQWESVELVSHEAKRFPHTGFTHFQACCVDRQKDAWFEIDFDVSCTSYIHNLYAIDNKWWIFFGCKIWPHT